MILKKDIHAQMADSWIWTGSKDGAFSFASARDLARENTQQCAWYSMVWFPSNCPKMATCLLRAPYGNLLTADRLPKFNVIQVNLCQLCKIIPESISHLFFECSYSSYIWSVRKLKLGLNQNIGSLTVEAKHIRDPFKVRNKLSAG